MMTSNPGRNEDSAPSSPQQSARSSSAPPSTPKRSMMAVYPLGAVDCAVCESRPTHSLAPCQHTVCYEHFLGGYDSESSFISLCGRCHEVSCSSSCHLLATRTHLHICCYKLCLLTLNFRPSAVLSRLPTRDILTRRLCTRPLHFHPRAETSGV